MVRRQNPALSCAKMNEIDDDLVFSSLEFLPEDLQQKMMPFQKDGVLFGIRKNGRYDVNLMPIQTDHVYVALEYPNQTYS